MLTPFACLEPDRLFAPIDFSVSPKIVVAVSGGGDSLALLDLAIIGLGAARIEAVTVDHGLRAESAAEAEQVSSFCSQRGIPHRTVRWDGPRQSAGLQAAARAARYRLLGEAARTIGATILLTGHNADDQAETVAMRAARGAGRGLAGMAPATLLDGSLWLLRPLLGVRREALRDHLRARAIGWIDDPSNENDAYERVRARRTLSDPAAFEAAIATAGETARSRERLGVEAAALIATCRAPSPGLIGLDPAGFQDAGRDGAIYALRLLLATAGGTVHLPDVARAAALLDRLGEERLKASLSRTTVEARGPAVWLRREARGLPQPSPAVDGQIWDGRFRLAGTGSASVAPLGHAAAKALAGEPADVARALVVSALATCPALHLAEGAPHLLATAATGLSARPVAAPFAAILAWFDLAPARALAALAGGGLPPSPPYVRHKSQEA